MSRVVGRYDGRLGNRLLQFTAGWVLLLRESRRYGERQVLDYLDLPLLAPVKLLYAASTNRSVVQDPSVEP